MNERWDLTLLHDRVVKLGNIGFGPFMQLNKYWLFANAKKIKYWTVY